MIFCDVITMAAHVLEMNRSLKKIPLFTAHCFIKNLENPSEKKNKSTHEEIAINPLTTKSD